MPRRTLAPALLVFLGLVTLAPAAAAPTDARGGVSGFLSLRPDLRKCASPLCGGWHASPVNLSGSRYAAELDLSALKLSGAARTRLEADLARGRAFLRGRFEVGGIEGFPQLARLVVTEAWRAATPTPTEGVVYRLVDRGLRCIAPPCFSTHAAKLSTAWHTNLSEVDFSTVQSQAVRERAHLATVHGLVLASGAIRAVPDAGPAGAGRELRVTQVWFRPAVASPS